MAAPGKAPCFHCGGYGYYTINDGAGTLCRVCGADIPDLALDPPDEFARQSANTPCGHGWGNMAAARVPYVCPVCGGAGLVPANLYPVRRDTGTVIAFHARSPDVPWSPDLRDPDNPIQEPPHLRVLLRYV